MRDREVRRDCKDWSWKLNSKEQEHWNKRLLHKAKLFRVKYMTLLKSIIEK